MKICFSPYPPAHLTALAVFPKERGEMLKNFSVLFLLSKEGFYWGQVKYTILKVKLKDRSHEFQFKINVCIFAVSLQNCKNMRYIHRKIEPILGEYLNIFPVIGLTGPRQSGKSTMLKKCLGKSYRYVTFDDINAVNFFHEDPQGFMNVYSEKVIFDEVQYVPELFRYVKIAVDNNRSVKGNYILTGSAQFSFMKGVTESLAGRIGILSLLPFEFREISKLYRNRSIYSGSYPELSNLKYKNIRSWYLSYVNTYLERDVRSLTGIGDIRDFSIFLKIIASKCSQILDLTDISNRINVSVNTVKKWVSILEASYIIFLLNPFYRNFGKRLLKRPKIYFYDTGLVSYLLGLDSGKEYEKSVFNGAIFENYFISEVKKRIINHGEKDNTYFFRSNTGKEIDLIAAIKNKEYYFEIKKTSTFRINMIDTLKELTPQGSNGYLIYNGKSQKYNSKISICDYKDILSESNSIITSE